MHRIGPAIVMQSYVPQYLPRASTYAEKRPAERTGAKSRRSSGPTAGHSQVGHRLQRFLKVIIRRQRPWFAVIARPPATHFSITKRTTGRTVSQRSSYTSAVVAHTRNGHRNAIQSSERLSPFTRWKCRAERFLVWYSCGLVAPEFPFHCIRR